MFFWGGGSVCDRIIIILILFIIYTHACSGHDARNTCSAGHFVSVAENITSSSIIVSLVNIYVHMCVYVCKYVCACVCILQHTSNLIFRKTIKIRTSRIQVDERHNVSQLTFLYYYYVPITVVGFRRARG